MVLMHLTIAASAAAEALLCEGMLASEVRVFCTFSCRRTRTGVFTVPTFRSSFSQSCPFVLVLSKVVGINCGEYVRRQRKRNQCVLRSLWTIPLEGMDIEHGDDSNGENGTNGAEVEGTADEEIGDEPHKEGVPTFSLQRLKHLSKIEIIRAFPWSTFLS